MSKSHRPSFLFLTLGFILGVGVMFLKPQPPLQAGSAHGNDKFSMCTVPVSDRNTDAVFVLDHLTGILRAGWVNTSGGFTHNYLRNVAADFRLNPATPEPKFAIVGGLANIQTGGSNQAANGIVYIGELTSGTVIAYGFGMPRGRGSAAPQEIIRLGGFNFREAIGG